MVILRHLPNTLTCLNLFLGCLGIYFISNQFIYEAFYCMLGAGVADFLDGFIARLLKLTSNIGKDLDSMADMVTFGVLPGFFMNLVLRIETFPNSFYIPFIAFIIPVFSALRLAIFNNDTEQSYSFKGVPTPANAIILASFAIFSWELLLKKDSVHQILEILIQPWFSIGFIIISSLLLVSRIPMMAMKFSSFTFKSNWPKILLVIGCVLLIVFFKFGASLPAFIFYILISQLNHKLT